MSRDPRTATAVINIHHAWHRASLDLMPAIMKMTEAELKILVYEATQVVEAAKHRLSTFADEET